MPAKALSRPATSSCMRTTSSDTVAANSITPHRLESFVTRKVVVVTPAKVRRVVIAGRCSCGQRLLKGMTRCPGCGTAIEKQ